MQSGQGSTAGGSTPSVQLWKSMQSSKAGSQDHQLHSRFLPQNLWHPSASWVTLKSREYSLSRNLVSFQSMTTISQRIIFTNLALAEHVALLGLRYVHLSGLYFQNLYLERIFQDFERIIYNLVESHQNIQNLPPCLKQDSGLEMRLWKRERSSWWVGPRGTDGHILHFILFYMFLFIGYCMVK